MMYKKIETTEEIDALVAMAYEIWTGYFGSLFDSQTLSIVIESAQSKEAILSQIADRYQYFFINVRDERVGYFAYQIDQERKELFLSKLYLLAEHRGQGIGRKVLQYLETLSAEHGINKLVLTVYHKNTDAVKAYEKWGFTNLGLIQRKFNDGLICDDFQMEKSV